MANKVHELLIKIIGKTDASLGHSVALTKAQLKSLVNSAERIDNVTWGGLTKAAKIAGAAAVAAGTATAVGLKEAYNVGSEFEKHMDQWAATADASQDQYNKARDAAMEWGRRTTKTATESADALTYMALAGWDVDRSIKSLPGILKLSEASNLDLATTSDLVTDAMAAQGVAADDLAHYLDVAAKANNRSNQTAEQFLRAEIKSGATFANLGISAEDAAVAFGLLANRGKKAEEAGTGMNSLLINMTTGAGQAGKMMDKLGLSAFDAQGNFKGLRTIFTELNERTKGMTEEERNAAFAAIGGKRQVQTLNDIMAGLNHTLANGKSEWDNLADEIDNADGALNRMAEVRMDNLWGDVKILQSALQDAGIRAYDGFEEPMREATQGATQAVYEFSKNVSDNMQYIFPTIKREMSDFADDVFTPMVGAGEWVIKHNGGVISAIGGVTGAITAFHVATKALQLKTFLGTMSTQTAAGLLSMSKVSLAVGAVTALIVAEKMHYEKVKRQDLANHFGKVKLSAQELKDVSDSITGEENKQRFSAFNDQLETLNSTLDEFARYGNGSTNLLQKAHLGIELSPEEITSLDTNIQGFIQSAQETLDQHEYTVNLGIRAFWGDNHSPEGDNLSGLFAHAIYESKAEIDALGQQLGDMYEKAIEDGVISIDESQAMLEIQQKISDITNSYTESQENAKLRNFQNKLNGGNVDGDTYKNLIQQMEQDYEEYSGQVDEMFNNEYAAAEVVAKHAAENGETLTNANGEEVSPEEFLNEKNQAYSIQAAKLRADNASKRLEIALGSNGYAEDVEKYYGNIQEQVSNLYNRAYQAWIDQGYSQSDAVLHAASVVRGFGDKGNFYSSGASRETLDNIKETTKGLEKYVEGIEQYSELGGDLTENQQRLVTLYNHAKELVDNNGGFAREQLGALGIRGNGEKWAAEFIGSDDDIYSQFSRAANTYNDADGEFVENVKEKHKEHESIYKSVATGIATSINSGLLELDQSTFAGGANHVAVSVTNEVQRAILSRGIHIPVTSFKIPEVTANPIAHHAYGGIVTSPTVSELAEAGDAEAVIPINRSQRAANLYEETGRLLANAGNSGASGDGINNFNFSVTVNGNANQADLRAAANDLYNQFKGFMARYQKDNMRLSY